MLKLAIHPGVKATGLSGQKPVTRPFVFHNVAPHAGAWIEARPCPRMILSATGRSPCGSVD